MSDGDWDRPPLTYLYPFRASSTSYGYAQTQELTDEEKEKLKEKERKKEAGEWPVGFVNNLRRR